MHHYSPQTKSRVWKLFDQGMGPSAASRSVTGAHLSFCKREYRKWKAEKEQKAAKESAQ